jgi:hypothetical protein
MGIAHDVEQIVLSDIILEGSLRKYTRKKIIKGKGCHAKKNRADPPSCNNLYPVQGQASPPACAPILLRWDHWQVINDGSSKRKLKNLFQMVDPKIGEEEDAGNDLIWHAPCIFWVFTIEGEAHHLHRQDSDEDFLQATQHMSKMAMG